MLWAINRRLRRPNNHSISVRKSRSSYITTPSHKTIVSWLDAPQSPAQPLTLLWWGKVAIQQGLNMRRMRLSWKPCSSMMLKSLWQRSSLQRESPQIVLAPATVRSSSKRPSHSQKRIRSKQYKKVVRSKCSPIKRKLTLQWWRMKNR